MEPYVYDVEVEMLRPVRARAGDRLIVRPGHERPVVVVRRTGGLWGPVRLGPPNYGALVEHLVNGVLTQRHPTYASLAEHPAVRSA